MSAQRDKVLALLAAAVCAGSGCNRQKVEVVRESHDRTGDYGLNELRAAVDKFRAAPESPTAFRELAVEIERLRPSFNKDVADEAERHLVFLGLGPMAAQVGEPFEEQMRVLALTVWPTALRVEPIPGETPRIYLERACRGPIASECKHVVPEYWPLILSARVWQRMKTRARDAYERCRQCILDPSFAALLEQYDQHVSRLTKLAKAVEDRSEPSAWPVAGPSASQWSGAPLLDLVPDPPQFQGEPIEGSWRDRLRATRPRERRPEVLGLHLRPGSELRLLRAVLTAAAAAGYRSVALQARGREYPYPLAEYRLSTGRGGRRPIEVRDVDTIQFLVRTLDNAGGTAGRPVRISAR